MSTAFGPRQESVTFADVRRQLNEVGFQHKKAAPKIGKVVDNLNVLERENQEALNQAKHEGKKEGYALGVEQATKVLQADAQGRIRLAEELARRDEDTGLYKKKEFTDRILPGFLYDAARDRRDNNDRRSELAALWYSDIDHLKPVNDDIDHDVGDRLISYLSEMLKTNIRQEDSISTRLSPEGKQERVVVGSTHGRIGGDEFLTLQINMTRWIEAYEVASRVKREYIGRDWAAVHPKLIEYGLRPSVSIGVAVLRLNSLRGFKDLSEEIALQWKRKAEAAMKVNKDQADHQVTVWGVQFDGEQLVDWELEDGIRQIIMTA
jgi:diguanylate cyclase (GGDEF)-like protein